MRYARASMFFILLAAFALCAGASEARDFSTDWRSYVELSKETSRLTFIAEVNGLYDIFIFPEGECSVSAARLKTNAETVAIGSGERVALTARLVAGREYALELRGEGDCTVEIMRRATGRSFSMAAELDNTLGSGLIARAGNAGWFRFTASGGRYAVRVKPLASNALALGARTYLPDGVSCAEAVALDDGSLIMFVECEPNRVYRVRVASPGGGTGTYTISATQISDGAPRGELLVAPEALTLIAGQMRALRALGAGDGECDYVCWESSDSGVAAVSDAGLVTAVGAGEAIITAHAYGGLRASAVVTVVPATPVSLGYFDGGVSLREGETALPELTVYPSAAAGSGITYISSDESVATVDATGAVTGVREGRAEIRAEWGEISATCTVFVKAAGEKRRALFIGVQEYDPGVNTNRVGSANTVINLAELFASADFEGGGYETRVDMDVTRDELLAAISEYFAPAREGDISLLYITCHGYFKNGVSTFQLRDGSELTAPDLERALREMPGTIFVLIDCCASGGAISDMSGFTRNIYSAFAGEGGALRASKYKVLASAEVSQDSYRLGYSEEEGGAATVFGRALCDALGWDMARKRPAALNADTNFDRTITLWEAYLYVSKRVQWYMSLAGAKTAYVQTPQIFPEGDQFVIYRR